MPQLVADFQAVLQDHTAGSPMVEELIWTDLTATDIAARLSERSDPVSVHIVEQLLDQHDIHRRLAQKDLPMGANQDRDTPFQNIARLKQQYLDAGLPLLSIGTKKRELLGNCHRAGTLLTTATLRTFDHDFPSFAEGVVIPQGLYDVRLNQGYDHLGTSHDTSEFACDCLADW